ncbi:MAG: MBL fold metallo-hydrolase [Clostridiales bacterium]|nr:MBL fold metallo-hydrolase [Clostridiales bacterium]
MIIKQVKLTMFLTNCYILIDEQSGKTLVIDPGKFNDRLIEELKSPQIGSIEAILLTHGHYDHIGGVKKLKDYCAADVYIHGEDAQSLQSAQVSLATQLKNAPFEKTKADKLLQDGDLLSFGAIELQVMHTPGHSPGSVCFLSPSTGDLFTGDTLFKLTIGRTDFPGSDWGQMQKSLKKIAALESDYKIYPGHEELSNLAFEKANNHYLRSL